MISLFIQWTCTLGDLIDGVLTVIGFAVALWQFRRQMKETAIHNDRANKTTWFLNVIVMPQLNLINKFYSDLVISTDKDCKTLCDIAGGQNFNKECAAIKNKGKNNINQFFDHIASLVESYDKSLATDFRHKVMELEDVYTGLLDNYDNIIPRTISNEILKNKKDILSLLNSEMTSNTK